MTYGEVVEMLKEKSQKQKQTEPSTGIDPKTDVERRFSDLNEIARFIGEDAILADELYQSDDESLKILAVLIDIPKSYTKDELYKRCEDLEITECGEKFCEKIIAHSTYAVQLVDEWSMLKNSVSKKAFAYYILGELAKIKNKISDDFFANYIEIIRKEIFTEPEEVKKAMNKALIRMTGRDKKVQELGKSALKEIKKQLNFISN